MCQLIEVELHHVLQSATNHFQTRCSYEIFWVFSYLFIFGKKFM